ncbi:type II toxin-antitoxin system RelE family toxin [Frankia sp. Cas3]|uniref:type II toxin-antitoxin system RelE family toxin n=1 Tax=Frankia sp. Cas3 TaxID=3073926 RepID=UPI003A1029EF
MFLLLAQDPRPPGCRSLTARAGALRVRVGDYRVVYQVRDAELVILIIEVDHRRQVYRG